MLRALLSTVVDFSSRATQGTFANGAHLAERRYVRRSYDALQRPTHQATSEPKPNRRSSNRL